MFKKATVIVQPVQIKADSDRQALLLQRKIVEKIPKTGLIQSTKVVKDKELRFSRFCGHLFMNQVGQE